MRVAIVNYGMGNLGSVRRALEDVGADPFIAECPAHLFDANRIVLPGVGAFSEGMARLREADWVEALDRVVRAGKPLLGICLGMQMLAERGEEGGDIPGLALVPGIVRRLDDLGCRLRIPHVGWNEVRHRPDDPLYAHVPEYSDFYFVHSFAFHTTRTEDVTGTTDYGVPVVASVRSQNVFGTQFHPEKSSRAGRQLLKNFLDYTPC